MKMTRILGVMVLALVLALCGNNYTFAEEGAGDTVAVQAMGTSELQRAIDRASAVEANNSANSYIRKLGLINYLNDKITMANEIAKNGTSEQAAEMVKVLNDATEATELFAKNTPKTSRETTATQTTTNETEHIAQNSTTAKPAPVATTIQLTVTDDKTNTKTATESQNTTSTVAKTSENSQGGQSATENKAKDDTTAKEDDTAKNDTSVKDDAETTSEVVELPNTGTTKRASIVTLIVAGVAVVVATAGISAVLLKAKRNS